jgi:hypothetical protein
MAKLRIRAGHVARMEAGHIILLYENGKGRDNSKYIIWNHLFYLLFHRLVLNKYLVFGARSNSASQPGSGTDPAPKRSVPSNFVIAFIIIILLPFNATYYQKLKKNYMKDLRVDEMIMLSCTLKT